MSRLILIRPLPYPNSERIDWISERSGPARQDVGAAPDYFALRDQNRIFEEVAAFDPMTVNWSGVERPEQLDAADVSPSFFQAMGSRPMLGRYLAPEEEGSKAPPVAVLSYAFWRNRLGSDPQIVGKTIALDRLPRTIIGVMPQGFDFPRGTQLWLPTVLDRATDGFPIAPTRGIFETLIIARRKLDVTPRAAATEMNRLTFLIRALYPERVSANRFSDGPRHSRLPSARASHWTSASGASDPYRHRRPGSADRLRESRQFAAGARRQSSARACRAVGPRLWPWPHRPTDAHRKPGANSARRLAGIGLAWLAVHVLDATKPAILERYPAISMDWRVLAFTIGLTLATSLVFGVVPALSAAGIHLQEALKSAGLSHSGTRGAARLRKILVVAEVGVSLILLIGAGLLTRSFLNLTHTELGFPSDHLLASDFGRSAPSTATTVRSTPRCSTG